MIAVHVRVVRLQNREGFLRQRNALFTPSPIDKPNMRRSISLLAATSLLASLSSTSPTRSEHQLPILADDNANTLPSNSSRVYGNNNATYGPVPRQEQLFQIEYLEIAPSPFEV
jgi:hypothetical protein